MMLYFDEATETMSREHLPEVAREHKIDPCNFHIQTHVLETEFIVVYLDPAAGQPISPNQQGQLIIINPESFGF